MEFDELEIGDVVYAAQNIVDDGSMPDHDLGQVLAQQGARGVIVNLGQLEDQPTVKVFLVRFEDQQLDLGPPIGCFTDDLSLEQP